MAFTDPGANLSINEEAGLPDNWVPVDEKPIMPGQTPGAMPAPPNQSPYFQTNLSPDFQHDTTFTGTECGSPHIPKIALMPMGIQGSPLTNAGIASTINRTFVSASSDTDIVVTDGLIHPSSPPPWWADPSFFYFVDDFVNWEGTGPFTDTLIASKGQVSRGWTFFGNMLPTSNEAARFVGGSPPFIGQFTQGNSATANQYAGLALNHVDGSVSHYEQSWALLENPGWIATWVFKVTADPLINATVGSDTLISSNKKAFYIGLAGASTNSIFSGSFLGPRPNVFIGLRYDTSRMPPSMQITSVANASAGSTVYTGTFGSNSWAGQNVTVTGCTNAVNNGTFACTASTTTTLTLSNASGVVETTISSNAVANPASIPLTSVNNASGGTTVYNYTGLSGIGTPTNSLVGISFVITGFTTAANNGTFTCVANTTTTMTLNNAAGAAETHAAFATGGTIGDSFWTFEAVVNRQFSTAGNTFAQGQTFVTSTPLNSPGFHRLDIICSTAGQVKLILDGNQNITFTIPTITIGTSGSGLTRATGQTAEVNFTLAAAGLNVNASYPPFAAGSLITWAGFVGGLASLNGAVVLDSQFDLSGSPYMYFPSTNNSGQNTPSGFTATGYPAFGPVFIWGNDNSAAPPTCFRMYVDFFGICWGKGMAGAPTSTSVTAARY